MGTRSNIGIKNLDGTYEVVYCHWDGYPSHNGAILARSYATEALVRELVSLGDMSSLYHLVIPTSNHHSYTSPDKDVTVFYHRDRGEPWDAVKPKIIAADDDPHQEEWCYIWDCFAGHWLFKGHGLQRFVLLTEESANHYGKDDDE